MADADNAEKKENQQDSEAQNADSEPKNKNDETKKPAEEAAKTDEQQEKNVPKTSAGGIGTWIMTAAVIVLFAGTGFGLGRLLKGSTSPEPNDQAETAQQAETDQADGLIVDDASADSKNTWYYPDLEPVVANLDVPGVTRYVRVALTLEINPQVDQSKGTALLKQKAPLLTNWLTIYLASLNLEDIRGDRNLKRIQLQILDTFNEKLFPDAKPQIKKVLFKEFAIQ
jgi:flagellar basal body-associated protein FliL